MDSIVMNYQEKCTRKCDPLGYYPVNIGHKAKPCTLLCFLSTLFFNSSQFLHI